MMLRKEGLGSGNAKLELLSPAGMYYSVSSGVMPLDTEWVTQKNTLKFSVAIYFKLYYCNMLDFESE